MRKSVAALAAAVIGLGMSVVFAIPASATQEEPPPREGTCVTDVVHHPAIEEASHKEYRYSKVIPGQAETSHTEWRFKDRTWIANKKEIKEVNGYDFVDGGTTRVNGQTIGGHWVVSSGWHTIPEVIINIVWGPGGVPDQYLGTGRVSLSSYGGPNVTVDYNAHAVDFSGWSEYGPWSPWSTTDPGAATDTRFVESTTVSDGNATPDVTVYYNPNGEPTSDLTDANWSTTNPGEAWTFVDKRKVIDQEYVPGWDETIYGPCPEPVACETYSSVHTTDLSTWDWSDTRATGHRELVDGGLRIWTEGATSTDKVAGYYATNFPLMHVGDETIADRITYDAVLGIDPGLQLVTDFDNDGTPDGILVGESVYGNDWWLSNGSAQFVKDHAPHTGGGYGSNWYGLVGEWLGQFPDAQVLAIGFSLGSGVHGEGVIKQLTFGCVVYTFGLPPAPPPTPPADTPKLATTGDEIGVVLWIGGGLMILALATIGVSIYAKRKINTEL